MSGKKSSIFTTIGLYYLSHLGFRLPGDSKKKDKLVERDELEAEVGEKLPEDSRQDYEEAVEHHKKGESKKARQKYDEMLRNDREGKRKLPEGSKYYIEHNEGLLPDDENT